MRSKPESRDGNQGSKPGTCRAFPAWSSAILIVELGVLEQMREKQSRRMVAGAGRKENELGLSILNSSQGSYSFQTSPETNSRAYLLLGSGRSHFLSIRLRHGVSGRLKSGRDREESFSSILSVCLFFERFQASSCLCCVHTSAEFSLPHASLPLRHINDAMAAYAKLLGARDSVVLLSPLVEVILGRGSNNIPPSDKRCSRESVKVKYCPHGDPNEGGNDTSSVDSAPTNPILLITQVRCGL